MPWTPPKLRWGRCVRSNTSCKTWKHRLAHKQMELADAEKKCGELEVKIGQPFEYEAKLQTLAVRQKELEEALDITKNQAANSLAAEATEPAVEVEPETETESVQINVRQSRVKTPANRVTTKVRVAMAH